MLRLATGRITLKNCDSIEYTSCGGNLSVEAFINNNTHSSSTIASNWMKDVQAKVSYAGPHCNTNQIAHENGGGGCTTEGHENHNSSEQDEQAQNPSLTSGYFQTVMGEGRYPFLLYVHVQ